MAGAKQNYSGTRLESIFWFFCVFTCISLDYRSELAQIGRQDTVTIHDHNHTKKNNKCGPQ